MKVSYAKLLKKLIDKQMTKRDLVNFAGITTNACTNISRQEPIAMNAAIKICRAFDCSIGDIMDISFDDEKPSYNDKRLPGKRSDYVFDRDYQSGLTRIYRKITNPDNPQGRPLLALVNIVFSNEITPEMFPEDPDVNPMAITEEE